MRTYTYIQINFSLGMRLRGPAPSFPGFRLKCGDPNLAPLHAFIRGRGPQNIAQNTGSIRTPIPFHQTCLTLLQALWLPDYTRTRDTALALRHLSVMAAGEPNTTGL